MKKVSGYCLVLLVLSLGFALYYYLDGKDYLAGKERHYVGTSNITSNELAVLADTKNILPLYSITDITLMENGLVEITYGFFSTDDYSFIVAVPFSYFDTPLMNTLYGTRRLFYSLGSVILITIVASIIFRQYPINIKDRDKKLLNAAWYIMHPRYLFSQGTAPQIYSPQIVADVDINSLDAGIYATRTWKYRKGYLHSSGWGQACWDNKILLTDKPLAENNESGVYSNRLGVVYTNDDTDFFKDIIGIVSLSGEWMEHADGVLRAESCEILILIVSHYYKAIANSLSATYGVPVVITDNPINAYMNWLFSDNGVSCMKHNAEILKGGTHGNERARNPKGRIAIKATDAYSGSKP